MVGAVKAQLPIFVGQQVERIQFHNFNNDNKYGLYDNMNKLDGKIYNYKYDYKDKHL